LSAWEDDALFVGKRIVERLAEAMPVLRQVVLIDDIDDSAATPRQTPSAVVLLQSMSPKTNEGAARVALEQDWLVMLALRPRRATADRNAEAAGPLISQCITALQGWKPEGANRVLAWVPGPNPDYGRDTSYFPLMFRIQLATT
jgi:hypothetical protein